MLYQSAFSFLLFSSCTMPKPPDRVALVYGISEYGKSQNAPNLVVADDDAEAVKNLLQNQGFNVTLKTNTEATKLPYSMIFYSYRVLMVW